MTIPVPLKERRARRIEARKNQILEAAATVFSQKGYVGATTREIAETADLSEGTLYNYFSSKRELLIGVAQAYGDAIATAIDNIEADNLEDMVAQLMTDRFRHSRERRLFVLFLHEARLDTDVRQYYVKDTLSRLIDATEKRVREWIEAGIMRPVDPAIAARTISAVIMGYGALFELGEDLWQGVPAADDGTLLPILLGEQVTDIMLKGLQQPTYPKEASS